MPEMKTVEGFETFAQWLKRINLMHRGIYGVGISKETKARLRELWNASIVELE